MGRRSTLATIAMAAFAAIACSGNSKDPARAGLSVTNPTGSCTAPDDGSRAGYSSTTSDYVWLPDCNAPLQREYWRVFATSETSSALLPRADGALELGAPCSDPAHPLHALVGKYVLCQYATSTTIAIVNDILPADALTITHFLHTQLKFKTVSGGIQPYAIPSDIIDACKLHPEANSPALVEMCQREQARIDSGNDIGFSYEGEGATELVMRLNELYGIP
jgi:hypothetical protein